MYSHGTHNNAEIMRETALVHTMQKICGNVKEENNRRHSTDWSGDKLDVMLEGKKLALGAQQVLEHLRKRGQERIQETGNREKMVHS